MMRIALLGLLAMPLVLALWPYLLIYQVDLDGIWVQYRSVLLYPVDAIVLLSGLTWMAGRLLGGSGQARLTVGPWPVLLALLILTTAALASIPDASDRVIAAGVAAQLVVLLLFYLAAVNLLTRDVWRQIAIVVALAVFLQAGLAGWQVASQTTAPAGVVLLGWDLELTALDRGASVVSLPFLGRWLRAYGSFPHPNLLAGYLVVTLALLAHPGTPIDGRVRRVALVLGVITLLLTFSRTGWLSLLLGALIVLPLWRGNDLTIIPTSVAGNGEYRGARGNDVGLLTGPSSPVISSPAAATFRWWVPPPVVVGIAVLFFSLALVRLGSLHSELERTAILQRLYYDWIAWRIVQQGAPVGAGNLVLAQQHLGLPLPVPEPAHNVPLIGLAELGWLGLFAWITMIAAPIVAIRAARSPEARAWAWLAAVALIPMLLFDHYLWTHPPGRALLVWICATLLTWQGATGQPTSGQPPT